MRTLPHRFSVIAAFSLLVVLLFGNALITHRQLGTVVEDHRWAVHSREVRLALEQAELLLVDAETSQRSYLYTGDAKYLKTYSDAVAVAEQHINRVRQLTADNPRQQQHVAALSELTTLKLQELADTIALYRASKDRDARSLVISGRGVMIMNDLRSEIEKMKVEEATVETQRDAAYRHSIHAMAASIYAATAVAILGLLALAHYILRERKTRDRHAREIRDREEWFRTTLTSIGDAVIATDSHGQVTFLNPIAETLTGVPEPEAQGKPIADVFPIFNELTGEATENPIAAVMTSGLVVDLANHTTLRHRDGHMTPIKDSAAPIRNDRGETIGVVLVFHDVTAERAAQEVLRKTEKLAAAARLSATVAHEINNPLEAVTNLIFLSLATPGLAPDLREHLTLAERELERVAHITRQTLGFYRDSNQPESIEIGSIVEAVLMIYSNKIESKRIHIERTIDNCPPVWGTAGELKQVVSNLLSNAIDAVAPGGHIAIICRACQTPGGIFSELIFEDDGPGIAPENVGHIFDPFFTTKQDVGTGLGLWVTREIISRHDGAIDVAPAQSLGGAAFVVHLPAHTSPEQGAH